jgi:hypothetical protein
MVKHAYKKPKTGPEPERVKISGDWKKAVKKALHEPLPGNGWPEEPKRYKARKKKPG